MRQRSDYMTPDEREQRLVSWAKQMIDGLRNRVVELEDAVATASSEHVGSEVALRQFRGGSFVDVPLPKGSKVQFKLPDPDFPEHTCTAEVFVERTQRSDRPFGRLIVNLSNGCINVVPSASNQIYIESRRF